MIDRIGALCLARCTVGDVRFYFEMVQAHDPIERLREIRRRHVYLARYMRVGPDYWEHLPTTEVAAYLRVLGEVIKAENSTAREVEDHR